MTTGEPSRRRSLAVYEAPPVPEGWHGHDVIRIIDPLGVQAAWIAPNLGGALIGWFVRQSPVIAWSQVLGAGGGQPGGELLMPDPAGNRFVPAGDDATRWGFIERDPTAVRVRGEVDGRRVEVSLRCDEGFHIESRAGDGEHVPGYRLRLHPDLGRTARVAGDGSAIRFGEGPVAGLEWRLGSGLRAIPATARGAPWHIDIVPEEHAGHDPRGNGFVLTATCRNA